MTAATIGIGLGLCGWIAFAVPSMAQDTTKLTIDALQPGQGVSLTGTVDRITDEDEFILRDQTGTVPVYVGPNDIPALVGDFITVNGTVDDDRPIEIYATSILRVDGVLVELPHNY